MSKNRRKWQPPYPDPNKGRASRESRPSPTHGRRKAPDAPRPRWCAWGNCPKHPLDDVPLCKSHLSIAYKRWAQYLQEERVARRDTEIWVPSYAMTRPEITPQRDLDPEPEPSENVGTVYFARSGGYIKIGWTSDLTKRMKAYPPDTLLMAVMPGARKDERAIHRKFAHLKTHGREWFPLAPQITEYIDSVVRDHGDPPVVDFAAKKATRIIGPRLEQPVGGKYRGPGTRYRRAG